MSSHTMPDQGPVTVVCVFRVQPGSEAAFEHLLSVHWPTLRACGLVTAEPARHWRLQERDGRAVYVEIFSWASARHSAEAHQSPQVMSVWGPMGEACEGRDGKPAMEFLHGEAVELLG